MTALAALGIRSTRRILTALLRVLAAELGVGRDKERGREYGESEDPHNEV